MSTFVKVKKTSKALIWFGVAVAALSGAAAYLLQTRISADTSSWCGVPLYKQTWNGWSDGGWQSYYYGHSDTGGQNDTTIHDAGCGPTSLAMLAAAWGVKRADGYPVTPADTAKYCLDTNNREDGIGTKPQCFLQYANDKGLKFVKSSAIDENSGKIVDTNINNIMDSLRNNYPAIISVGPYHQKGSTKTDTSQPASIRNKYTSSGHYIVVTHMVGDTVYINDPNKNNTSDNFYNLYYHYVKNGFWFIYK